MTNERLRIIMERDIPTCVAEFVAALQFGEWDAARSQLNRLAALIEEAGQIMARMEAMEAPNV